MLLFGCYFLSGRVFQALLVFVPLNSCLALSGCLLQVKFLTIYQIGKGLFKLWLTPLVSRVNLALMRFEGIFKHDEAQVEDGKLLLTQIRCV